MLNTGNRSPSARPELVEGPTIPPFMVRLAHHERVVWQLNGEKHLYMLFADKRLRILTTDN